MASPAIPPPAVPRATYRLQLHAGFTFADAMAVVPLLADLGISHLYLSPVQKARPGSSHGYDIVDHTAWNPELGDGGGFERLAAIAAAHGIGIVLDVVPNHMEVGSSDNAWWQDVLEWGEDSPFARYFDIDWQPSRLELKGKVLLPVLGDHYGAILEKGELVARFDAASGGIRITYWDNFFPVAVRDYPALLRPALAALAEGADAQALAAALEAKPGGEGGGRVAVVRRRRGLAVKAALADVAAARPRVAAAIDAALAALSGDIAALDRLLGRQSYRISSWRVAADEINYRRFFDINNLAAIRMVEEPELFATAHRLVFDLVGRGLVQGLRVDHVDGLFNPAEYCRLVQEGAGRALGRPVGGSDDQPIWLVVEKILAPFERIRRDWPVAGTTGYDFTNQVVGLFVDGDAEAAMTVATERFVGFAMDFEGEVLRAKMRIIDEHMASELRMLVLKLGRIAGAHWRSRDFPLSVLYTALKLVVACLPVYRTYVTSRRVTDTDRQYIQWALKRARKLGLDDEAVFAFVEGVLDTSLARDEQSDYPRRAIIDFAMRLQQYSGPVMAKGFEDTALYRANRLICLNEVGGDPLRFGLSAVAFHQAARSRGRSQPHALLATATHDTKRGEDTRARIAALSEVPEEWGRRLERWHQLNAPFRRQLAGGPAPEPNDELFLYQTMVGAWPEPGGEAAFFERLATATVKAIKEAKRRTSWAAPDTEYEAAVVEFVHRIGESNRGNAFLDDLRAFHAGIKAIGMVNGMAQVLLKMTCPGIPDFYQGAELWDLSLVDPDNRRPVDFDLRRRLAGSLGEGALPADPARWRDGAVKQELIRRTLGLRRRHPELFAAGAYRPLAARGGQAGHVLAFARQDQSHAVVVAMPLLLGRLWPGGQGLPPLGAAWRNVHVETPKRGAGANWRNLLTGQLVVPVVRRGIPVLNGPDLFADFPLALLEEEGGIT